MADGINFPDVLGYMAGSERLDLGNLQVTATSLPSTIKAGKTFRLVLIFQNMVDSPIKLTVSLAFPNDALGKKNKFSAKTPKIEVGLQPAEVGMVLLPIGSAGDTAQGAVKFPITISDVKTERQGGRIRSVEGGSPLYLDGLKPDKRKLLDNFAKQTFVGGKKALFGGAVTLSPSVTFHSSGLTEASDAKAEYRSLWVHTDFRQNPVILLDRFKAELMQNVLPALERTQILAPLIKQTGTRFKQAGYELTEIEAKLIGRAMTNVLEYACTGRLSYALNETPRPEYQVLSIIQRPAKQPVTIKLHWLIALLNAMAEDARVVKTFWKLTLQNWFYDALLRDTLVWGLDVVEVATGLELGTPEEFEVHADAWFEKFQNLLNDTFDPAPLLFEDVYLPLVIAGIAVHDKVALPSEDVRVLHPQFRTMLGKRLKERTEDNAPLFDIAAGMLSQIVGDDSIILSITSNTSANSRTHHIPYTKRKTEERDIKAIVDFFERPVSEMRVVDPYLADYERLYNRLGAYVQLAFEKGALKSLYVQTRDAPDPKNRQEQLTAITDLKKRFPSVQVNVHHPEHRKDHDRYIHITRPDGSKARLLIGRGLDFIRSNGSVRETYLVIEEL